MSKGCGNKKTAREHESIAHPNLTHQTLINVVSPITDHVDVVPSPNPNTNKTLISPISRNLRENELGKAMISVAIPVLVALLIYSSGDSKKLAGGANRAIVGLMAGCVLIWSGIISRKMFDGLADMVELVGIGVVWGSLFGLVATALVYVESSWPLMIFCVLAAGLCLLPVILSLFWHVKRLAVLKRGG